MTVRRLALAVGVLALAGIAEARPSYTSSQSGNWNQAATWGGAGVPGLADTVTIQNTHVVQLTDARQIESVTVNSGGCLEINGAGGGSFATLTFPATAFSPALNIAGADGVVLVDNAKIIVNTSMSFTGTNPGTSSLKGSDDGSVYIEIGDNTAFNETVTLTLDELIVYGELNFVGIGSAPDTDRVINQGHIHATTGTMLLASSLEFVDDTADTSSCSAYRWAVVGGSSVLSFQMSPAALAGDFKFDAGTLVVGAGNVATTGKVKLLNSPTVPSSPTFSASGGNCP